MKLIHEKLLPRSEEEFTFKEIHTRSFSCPWHFHTELELILTLQFEGCRQLAETDAKITEVAFSCGFTNLSNFNRQFLRLKGMTPREHARHLGQLDPGNRSPRRGPRQATRRSHHSRLKA